MSVRQSCRVLSVRPHGCVRTLCVLRHCPSISRQQPSVKRTQDALCEASFWPHSAMATPTKQQRAQCRQGMREQGKNGWMGSTQKSCQSKTLTQLIQAWRRAYVLKS